ncbi:uncharacterized protein KY384_006624 [Bacidia gigantensis]|uniref:uncharacterized protein n=1 Tax=Bacidia gigantensis TaxID=2732470 RepID=UPI001D0465FA|nr:uncharacterized protein KY384_006624 [Bacidia gigantensis]KAG8528935.1 hypothetical protein KY384_006624 [Bacidia gigantensis]
MWAGDVVQDASTAASITDVNQFQFDDFTPEASAVARLQAPTSGTDSPSNGSKYPAKVPGVLRQGDPMLYRNGDGALPPEKAFAIQIGWRLFRLSGASILSDGPSYFSTFFEEQMRQHEEDDGPVKTLYIDRDPETFADICRHLQGYYIVPHDNAHYVRLYADAQFYSLPRLISQLFESDIYTTIGGVPFQIPRDTFSGPGNSSNFFTLGFSGMIGTRENAFPGLESRGLMRPPPVPPQSIPNRSPEIFADLINFSRGYPITIRDPDHRAALLSDCKYYGFKGLMHQIFAHDISYNAARSCTEIVMRLEDIHKSGVSFYSDPLPSDQSPLGGWVHYSRPFVDETSYEVIVEIGSAWETKVDFRSMRAEFHGDTKARISSLFQTVADKMNLPSNLPLGLMMSSGGASAAPASPANTPLSEDRVKINIGGDAHIMLDGQEHIMDPFGSSAGQSEHEDWSNTPLPPQSPVPRLSPRQFQSATSGSSMPGGPPSKKRKRRGSLDEFGEWIIRHGQWRLRVQAKQEYGMGSVSSRMGRAFDPQSGTSMEIVLWAVRLEAVSGQRGRNMARGWVN